MAQMRENEMAKEDVIKFGKDPIDFGFATQVDII